MNKLQKEMNELIIKRKDRFYEWFERYYDIKDYWDDETKEYLIRNVSFNWSCGEWLRAIMFYRYEINPFANDFLLPSFNDEFDDEKLSNDQAHVIHNYFISKFVVSLIVEKKTNTEFLHKSLNYYEIYLLKRGYKNECDMFDDKELDTSDILFDVVPSGLVKHIMGVGFDNIISKIDRNVRTHDMIWSYAWRLLYRLETGELENIDKCWKDLINGWKKCYIKDYYNGFHASTIVLLYYSYCRSNSREFQIEELINEIVGGLPTVAKQNIVI